MPLNRNTLPDLIRMILTYPELSDRVVARSVGSSPETVRNYRKKMLGKDPATLCGADGELLDGYALDGLLNNRQNRASASTQPDWDEVEAQVKSGKQRQDVWRAFRAANPNGLSRAQFCAKLKARTHGKSLEMMHDWEPGYAVQVDFSGDKPSYRDPDSGRDVSVELFVGMLPYSHLVFACCVPDQSSPSWLSCCVQMLAFYGGAPKVVIPDNLKAAITTPGKEAVVQRHFLDLARHFQMAVLPAGANEPRQKGAVEGTVGFAQRQLLNLLAEQEFYSIDEVNAAIAALLPRLNDRLMQNRDGDTRRSIFEREERTALRPLPAKPFVYMETRAMQAVPLNYHVRVDNHEYSVPHALVGQKVQPRVGLHAIEVCHGGKVVARHARSNRPGHHTTAPEHMPEAHREQKDATPDGLRLWARTCGDATSRTVERFFDQKVPLQGLPSAQALRNLTKGHTKERIELACERAWALKMPSITGVKHALAILQDEEDRARLKDALDEVRGARSPNALARRRALDAERRRRKSTAQKSAGAES